jgi:tetratricopeptide (TPR) repeat protein
MSLRSKLFAGFLLVQISFCLPSYLAAMQAGQADQASGKDKGQSQQENEVTFPKAFKPVGYTPRPLPISMKAYFAGLKEYQSSGELVLEKDALTFESDKDKLRIGYQQIELVTHERLPSRFPNQPPVDWVVVRFRSTANDPQLAMFCEGRHFGRGRNVELILESIQWAVNANKKETAARRSTNEAALSPLARLTHWVELLEAAESGRTTGVTGEELNKTLAQANTEMKAFLDAHPDDVDAIILSVRLARFQETSGVGMVSGKNAEEELAQAAREKRARVDAQAARLDHALHLKPDRADAYYWKARIYGVSQPAIRNGRFVRVSIDLQEATRNCRRASELAPENAAYREALAQYLVMDEKYDDAADVMRPVAGGRHIISLLLADRKALPVPDKAVRNAMGTAGLADVEMENGRIHDYPELRVDQYVINAPAAEVTAFYRKRWPEFQFFEAEHEKNNDIEVRLWGQALIGPSHALHPLASKHDFDKASKAETIDGMGLALVEFRQRSENKRKDLDGIPVGDVYCVLTVLDFRAAPAP